MKNNEYTTPYDFADIMYIYLNRGIRDIKPMRNINDINVLFVKVNINYGFCGSSSVLITPWETYSNVNSTGLRLS